MFYRYSLSYHVARRKTVLRYRSVTECRRRRRRGFIIDGNYYYYDISRIVLLRPRTIFFFPPTLQTDPLSFKLFYYAAKIAVKRPTTGGGNRQRDAIMGFLPI